MYLDETAVVSMYRRVAIDDLFIDVVETSSTRYPSPILGGYIQPRHLGSLLHISVGKFFCIFIWSKKMTTAARPTFEPARGGQGRGEKDLSAISKQYSSRDLPGHTKLKFREHGQGTTEELRARDFRKELDEKERERSKARPSEHVGAAPKRLKLDQVPAASLDADDPLDEDDSDDDDSEDDTATLLAELARIRKERAAEQLRMENEKRQEEERIRMENILSGNPLLNYSAQATKTDLKVKRRWDDDVVFKNCARSEPEKQSNQFINDSLRSDFHKKFMEKYIK